MLQNNLVPVWIDKRIIDADENTMLSQLLNTVWRTGCFGFYKWWLFRPTGDELLVRVVHSLLNRVLCDVYGTQTGKVE